MAAEDVLFGVAISGGNTNRTYTKYRIDYNDERDISEFVSVEDLDGSIKNPPLDYPGHESPGNYKRKVLVAEGDSADSVLDDITSSFDAASDGDGIGYNVEDVSPSQDERDAMEEYGAMNGLEGHDAERWAQAVVDLDNGNITMDDFQHGKNPHRGYEFGGPSNRERGREVARNADPPDDTGRPDNPAPIDTPSSS